MKRLFTRLIVSVIFAASFTSIMASSVNFKCNQGVRNAAKDSIVYAYDAASGYFAQDFTLYQVNTSGTKAQFIKNGAKVGWRLNMHQALHFYANDSVQTILSIDILCEDDEYADSLISVSSGELMMIGSDVMRIIFDSEVETTELKLSRDTKNPAGVGQFRPKEITINYLKKGESYEAPIPLLPIFEPASETYFRPWDIILSTEEPNAVIRYTIDGSTPTLESPIYSTPIYVDKETKIKAITCTEVSVSPVDSAMYHIEELPDTLKAGSRYLIDFPEFGRTAQETPAIAEIYMPTNYESTKKYPLFVWFGPGNGGYSTSRVRAIFENKDVICVGLPYRSWKSGNGGWMTPWEDHKMMLDSIENLIDNIDPRMRMAGGWSSGGAMTMQHIAHSDEEFQDYFYAFLPGGSGFDLGKLETIKHRPMLITIGEDDPRQYSLGDLAYKAELIGVDVTYNLMKGVGHELPTSQYPFMREWIYKKVILRDEEQSNVLLDTIKVEGNTIETFDPQVFGYLINLSSEDIPSVEAIAQNESNTITIDPATEERNWVTYIFVKAEDGNEQKYSVYFHVMSSNAFLNCIMLDGKLMDGYEHNITSYEVKLTTTEIPKVHSWGQSAEAKVTIVQATQIPGTATITCIAEDGTDTTVYNVNFVSETAGLSSSHSSTVEVYPNPARDHITVKGEDITEISILSLDGKSIRTLHKMSATEVPINISDLVSGIYILKVIDNSGQTQLKWMKR